MCVYACAHAGLKMFIELLKLILINNLISEKSYIPQPSANGNVSI